MTGWISSISTTTATTTIADSIAATASGVVDVDIERTMARLGVALAIGLLVGLQRQFAKQGDDDDLFAGARTFALIGLTGGLSALLAKIFDSPLVFAVGLAMMSLVVAVGYVAGMRAGGLGVTTEIAAIVTFLAGALAGLGEFTIGAAVAVATTTLLAAKPYTKQFVSTIDEKDVKATLQFAVLVALILPVLPRQPIGPAPIDAASPFKVGLMVVFILGLSFLGYVLIKIVGPRRGIGLTGILGGLVSSTAVTLTMSERSKSSAGLLRALAMAVLLAWTIMYGRVLVEVGVVNTELLREVWLPIGAGLLFTGSWAAFVALRRWRSRSCPDAPDAGRFRSHPVRVGERVDRLRRVEAAGVRHDPQPDALEPVGLLAHHGPRQPERRSVGRHPGDRNDPGPVLTHGHPQRLTALAQLCDGELRRTRRGAVHDVRDADPAFDQVGTVVIGHPCSAIDLVLDDPGAEQRRVEPVSWVGEVRLGHRRPQSRVDADDQQAQARADQVGHHGIASGLELGACEPHRQDRRHRGTSTHPACGTPRVSAEELGDQFAEWFGVVAEQRDVGQAQRGVVEHTVRRTRRRARRVEIGGRDRFDHGWIVSGFGDDLADELVPRHLALIGDVVHAAAPLDR